MRKKEKKTFSEEIYEKISINDLILFSSFLLINSGEKCTFENLVCECFFLFPKVFSLSGHAQWPDSRKLDRPLRTLRKEKMISGNPKTEFVLSIQGKKKALAIANVFRQKKLL